VAVIGGPEGHELTQGAPALPTLAAFHSMFENQRLRVMMSRVTQISTPGKTKSLPQPRRGVRISFFGDPAVKANSKPKDNLKPLTKPAVSPVAPAHWHLLHSSTLSESPAASAHSARSPVVAAAS
jgi:hypothetical protein